jgi:sec-independent protein translocase protein TatA
MPSFHWPDLIFIAAIALLVFGPKRLPEIGSSVGKTIREFQKSMREIKDPAPDAAPAPATPPATPIRAAEVQQLSAPAVQAEPATPADAPAADPTKA